MAKPFFIRKKQLQVLIVVAIAWIEMESPQRNAMKRGLAMESQHTVYVGKSISLPPKKIDFVMEEI